MQCEFVYKNGESCKNESLKNSKYCAKHKYYGKHKYNEQSDDEIQETPRISNNVIQERSEYIQDNPYNRYFIKQCINESTPPPKQSSYADYLPILMMFLPILKQLLGTQEVLNLFKNFKNLNGIKENFKTDNNITHTDEPPIPIIPTTSQEVPIVQNRDSATTPP